MRRDCSPPNRLRAASAVGNRVNRSKARTNSVTALVSSVRGGARSPVGLALERDTARGLLLPRQRPRIEIKLASLRRRAAANSTGLAWGWRPEVREPIGPPWLALCF